MSTQPRSNERSDLVSLSEERAVIMRLQEGDRSAFATLYEWYGLMIYRQAIVPRLANRELAEDCLRDTFKTAMEKIASYRDSNRSIFFWLRRIAINKAIDVHRRQSRDKKLVRRLVAQPEVPLGHQPEAPDRGLERQDAQKAVHSALENVNARYARALRMRLLEDRSREECADALGVSVGNFDVILHRAAKAFRKVFK